MNKTFTLILIALAVALIAYNVTIVDFQDPFNGDSTIALIGIVASLCAVLLLLIFRTSKKIQKKIEQRD
ncbi:hypothetical protein SAMN05421766_101121 [Zobellia uliginosa]|uniref:Uncharacterized protein n=1 Tax=Zobellia uliginosa TaxID=143224 RepID=A0ABY1KMF0_9FLAO|nr:hypothetical protein [Zobellia uliginosa]SIS37465.1 hypothetical protein SAMN05421766_101121 [Zobellia uliginosa]